MAMPRRVRLKNTYSTPHSSTVPTMMETLSWPRIRPPRLIVRLVNGVSKPTES